jgi:hypothetical protein
MRMSTEQKITLDDGINNLAREVEVMMMESKWHLANPIRRSYLLPTRNL